jgi:acyl-CoA synthetase (AMP-forming)/AMP-acid ligase II
MAAEGTDTMKSTFRSILSCLEMWAERVPHKLAFGILNNSGELDARIDFGELHGRSLRVSAWLSQRVSVGDRVAIMLPTSIEFVLAYYGCLLAGIIPVPLSRPTRRTANGHLAAVLRNCEAKICLTGSAQVDKGVEASFTGLQTIAFTPGLFDSLAPAAARVVRADDLAFLQYTSGSTSAPKGVMVSHRNIMANSAMIAAVLGHDHDSIEINWMPLFHDMGLVNHVLQPVYNGNTSLLMEPVLFVQRPRLWLEAISRYRVTSTGGPNFCYEHCVHRIKPEQLQDLDLSCLKVAFNGAEPIKPQVLRRFTELCEKQGFSPSAWLPCYGLAEGTLIVTGIPHGQGYRLRDVSKSRLLEGVAESAAAAPDATQLPSVGVAVPGVEVLIMEPQTLCEQPRLTIGEVWASGENIAQGYWRNPAASDETFVSHRGRRYLRTGDLGFLDEHDELFVTGRLKDLIIIDGKNHYPQDLELTAQSVDERLRVNAGVAFSLNPDLQSEKVIIVQEIATKQRGGCDSEQLLVIGKKIRAAINREHAIAVSEVVFIGPNTIPKTTSGKIQRRRVKELYERGALEPITLERVGMSMEPSTTTANFGSSGPLAH